MIIKSIRPDLREYLVEHGLLKKWLKAADLFEKNMQHPSLNTELLEPRWRGIYSFRLDKKYRALFFITKQNEIEVFQITNHYKK